MPFNFNSNEKAKREKEQAKRQREHEEWQRTHAAREKAERESEARISQNYQAADNAARNFNNNTSAAIGRAFSEATGLNSVKITASGRGTETGPRVEVRVDAGYAGEQITKKEKQQLLRAAKEATGIQDVVIEIAPRPTLYRGVDSKPMSRG